MAAMMSWEERQEHEWRTGHTRYGAKGFVFARPQDRRYSCLECDPAADRWFAQETRRAIRWRLVGIAAMAAVLYFGLVWPRPFG